MLRTVRQCVLPFVAACLLCMAAGSCVAWADEVDDAQVALDQAESALGAIVADIESLDAEINALQDRIDETASDALQAQTALFATRDALGDMAAAEYRDGTPVSLMAALLSSRSIDDLVRNVTYCGAVLAHQSDLVAEKQARSDEFDALVADLNSQKNEQESKRAEMDAKRAEAEAVVANASAQLSQAQAEQAARIEELARAAAEAGQHQAPAISDDANTVDREDAVAPGTPVAPDPNPPAGGGQGGGTVQGGSESDVPWLTGIASAYGGSSDPHTPNPGTTATGAVCDDWSMGVAVPMSLPNYRSYFGRTVEIRYNGMTVLATVNDCGSMGGGSRALDLQPGVFKAFGYGDCYAWGLRQVSYRFL